MINRESDIYSELGRFLRFAYPNVSYHFSPDGIWTPSHSQRNLYGSLNRRAWPDLLIAQPVCYKSPSNFYAGLFIEIKTEGVRLKKRDGSWSTVHIAEQARVLEELMSQGYIATFGVGLDECIEIIDSYLKTSIMVSDSHA